jgi:hypothetical protein
MFLGWRRLIAGLIICWAMMDMTVPGVCQSDDLEATLGSTLSVMHAPGSLSETSQISSLPSNTSPDRPGPEDCFCCSSHTAPTSIFDLNSLFSFLGFQRALPSGSPHDFSPFLYHPPKA